ncbi:hypothetical protein BCR34DRAFT_267500 [Clohesyomyces aquaticus]|uniref:Uncharacterized protein n=1 Tax=Clohesyomyces aquaticus TaxID=1231657 RepID=A0A1Y1ZT19_9PLEO|nr:hypothetical protein BCR34DRAFT_267500 [Clohesyomyces aquaticus]
MPQGLELLLPANWQLSSSHRSSRGYRRCHTARYLGSQPDQHFRTEVCLQGWKSFAILPAIRLKQSSGCDQFWVSCGVERNLSLEPMQGFLRSHFAVKASSLKSRPQDALRNQEKTWERSSREEAALPARSACQEIIQMSDFVLSFADLPYPMDLSPALHHLHSPDLQVSGVADHS